MVFGPVPVLPSVPISNLSQTASMPNPIGIVKDSYWLIPMGSATNIANSEMAPDPFFFLRRSLFRGFLHVGGACLFPS
jgi:hypothetical protein